MNDDAYPLSKAFANLKDLMSAEQQDAIESFEDEMETLRASLSSETGRRQQAERELDLLRRAMRQYALESGMGYAFTSQLDLCLQALRRSPAKSG